MLNERTGFTQGFEAYYETWRLGNQDSPHPAETLVSRELGAESDRPFFLFVNLNEAHSPYDSSRQYFGLFDRHPQLSSVGYTAGALKSELVGDHWYSREQFEHLLDLYDSEIRYVDFVVGNIVETLRREAVLEETLIVITSDHGEHFGEHGLREHALNLYETNVRSALLVRFPKLFTPGSRDSSQVQLHDLFETILDAAGSSGRHTSRARSLLAGSPSETPVFLEFYSPVFFLGERPETDLAPFMRRLRAVRDGRFKLILGSDGTTELYDVADDPEELQNLAGRDEYADELESLQAQLVELLSECPESPQVESSYDLDDETIRQLKTLGYIQ
jgi:arylsulfatase A-like enzyme